MNYIINSEYGKRLVNADNISEARYKYADIMANKNNINFQDVLESITESITSSMLSSVKKLE